LFVSTDPEEAVPVEEVDPPDVDDPFERPKGGKNTFSKSYFNVSNDLFRAFV